MLLKTVLTTALLAIGLFAEPEAAEGCGCRKKPGCCGCTGNAKHQVEVLTNLLFEGGYELEPVKTQPPNIEVVVSWWLKYSTPELQFQLFGHLCKGVGPADNNDNKCCNAIYTLDEYADNIGDNDYLTAFCHINGPLKEKTGGDVYVPVQCAFSNYRGTDLWNYTLTWIPTTGCNYKLDLVEGRDYACLTSDRYKDDQADCNCNTTH